MTVLLIFVHPTIFRFVAWLGGMRHGTDRAMAAIKELETKPTLLSTFRRCATHPTWFCPRSHWYIYLCTDIITPWRNFRGMNSIFNCAIIKQTPFWEQPQPSMQTVAPCGFLKILSLRSVKKENRRIPCPRLSPHWHFTDTNAHHWKNTSPLLHLLWRPRRSGTTPRARKWYDHSNCCRGLQRPPCHDRNRQPRRFTTQGTIIAWLWDNRNQKEFSPARFIGFSFIIGLIPQSGDYLLMLVPFLLMATILILWIKF